MQAKQHEEALDNPGDWLQDTLAAWLRKRDWQPGELVEFLEGYGLPATQDGEEPHLALLEALPEGGNRFTAEAELARRAAVLLNEIPDVRTLGDPPERLLYNLLFLCAGLSCPDELADPLIAMGRRKALAGEWQGLDLRYALTAALIANQLDSRMAPEWKAMLARRQGEFLLGHEYDGFEGTLWMPESREKRGEPFLAAIGEALKTIAELLEEKPTRRLEFRAYINRVKETYPDKPDWDRELIFLADRTNLPAWAVECLPSLFLLIDRRRSWLSMRSSNVVLIWNVLTFCLPGDWKPRSVLCNGQVVEAELAKDIYLRMIKVASRVERLRLDFPYRSERGLQGAVSDLFEEIRISRQRHKEKDLVKEGHPAILKRNKIGFTERSIA